MYSEIWERLADTLFWLQLCWVLAGFLLMIYLAFKVVPHDKGTVHSQIGKIKPGKPESVILGGYRFEVTQGLGATHTNVIEIESEQLDHSRRAR